MGCWVFSLLLHCAYSIGTQVWPLTMAASDAESVFSGAASPLAGTSPIDVASSDFDDESFHFSDVEDLSDIEVAVKDDCASSFEVIVHSSDCWRRIKAHKLLGIFCCLYTSSIVSQYRCKRNELV